MKNLLGWLVALVMLVVLAWKFTQEPTYHIDQIEVDADVQFQVPGKWLKVSLSIPQKQVDVSGLEHVFASAKYSTGNTPGERPDRKGKYKKPAGSMALTDGKFTAANVIDETDAPASNYVRWVFVQIDCDCKKDHYASYEWMAPNSVFEDGAHDFFEVHRR